MRADDNNYCNIIYTINAGALTLHRSHYVNNEGTLTNDVTPCNTFPLENLIVLRKVAKFPSFYEA